MTMIDARGQTPSPDGSSNQQGANLLSRRHLLQKAAIIGAGALGLKLVLDANDKANRERITPENEFIILHDAEQISLSAYGLNWTPDGHIPFVTFADGDKTYFISANASTFAFKKKGDSFVPDQIDGQGKALPCYGPDKSREYRNGYSSITSILQSDPENQDHLYGITHNEEWAEGSYVNATFSIGLVESFDRGKTWVDQGSLIEASDALPPGGEKVTGVGQPCAIIREENGERFIYIYYLYLPSGDGKPYNINLSRAKIDNGVIGEIEHFTKDGFRAGVEVSSDILKPVIIPNPGFDSYTALPSVRYNTGKNRFEAVFEMQDGFYASSSKDGIKWNPSQQILRFPNGQYPHFDGQDWYSNPSLWSEDQPSDQLGSDSGYLVYSRGKWPQPHTMERRKFKLK